MGMSHENVEGGAFQTEGSTCAKALQEEFACLKKRGRATGLAQGGWWRPSDWRLAGDEVRQVEETRSIRAGITTAGQI